MNGVFTIFRNWFGLSGPLSTAKGQQVIAPTVAIAEDTLNPAPDAALQVSAVWRSVELISKVIGTLPLFVYENTGSRGQRELARTAGLYSRLHDKPNERMTAPEFWGAMVLSMVLRGNAYARLRRGLGGTVESLWPLSSDQVMPYVMDNGELVFIYQESGQQKLYLADEILHLKDLGNGTTGMSRLDFMRNTVTEAARAQAQATRVFRNGDKPSGLLTIDRVLTDDQRKAIRRNFAEIAEGPSARLFVIEAGMKYEPVTLSPEDVQLLQTRQFGVEEVCRWFGVPPVLLGHSNVTTWGSGIEQIIAGFHKLTIRPLLVQIESAIRERVLTPAERARYTVEFSLDALLRGSTKERYEIYSTAVQNALMTRNEVRQLENWPPMEGGDDLTLQSNLVRAADLGKQPPAPAIPMNEDDSDATKNH